MKRRTPVRIALLAISVLLLSSGCWDYMELNQQTIELVYGVDTVTVDGHKLYRVTRITLRPAPPTGNQGNQQSGQQAWVVSTSTGRTIWEASANFGPLSPRRLFIPHIVCIVVGENAAREGIDPYLDLVARFRGLRLRSWILVAKGEAKDILEATPTMESTSGAEIIGLIRNRVRNSKAPVRELYALLNDLSREGADPYTARIALRDSPPEKKTPTKELVLNGTAVFRGSQLVGWLNPVESRGLLWAKGEVPSASIPVTIPGGRKITIDSQVTGRSLKVRFENGRPSAYLELQVKGRITEIMGATAVTPALIKELEEREAKTIANEIRAAFQTSQQLGADAFGIGHAFHRAFPRLWPDYRNRWHEVFPYVRLHTNVKARITGSEKILSTIFPRD